MDEPISEQLPVKNPDAMNIVEGTVTTIIDEAIQKGILKGRAIGIEKGKIQHNIETIARLIKAIPTMKDEVIAGICKVEKKWVAKIRKTFQSKRKATVKKFARSAYEKIPGLTAKELVKLEKAIVQLWGGIAKISKGI